MNWAGLIRFVLRYGYVLVTIIENVYRIASRKTNDMERVGMFTPEQEKMVIDAITKRIKLTNKLYTWLAKFGVKMLVRGIDNFGLDLIRQDWKNDLIPVLDAAILGQREKVRGLTADLLNKKIDINRLDDEQELVLFDSITKSVALSIDIFMQKQINN